MGLFSLVLFGLFSFCFVWFRFSWIIFVLFCFSWFGLVSDIRLLYLGFKPWRPACCSHKQTPKKRIFISSTFTTIIFTTIIFIIIIKIKTLALIWPSPVTSNKLKAVSMNLDKVVFISSYLFIFDSLHQLAFLVWRGERGGSSSRHKREALAPQL